MATTACQIDLYPKDLKMCQVVALLLFSSKSLFYALRDLSSCSPHALQPPPIRPSSPTSSLFEKALVEEMGVTGGSLILQTEEQVPEIDTCDALPCGSGA